MIHTKRMYFRVVFLVTFIVTMATLALFPKHAKAATISENGTYHLDICDPYEGTYINGNSSCLISFDFDEGEETVTIEELTQGMDFFLKGRKFLGFKEAFGSSKEFLTEFNKSDFKGHSAWVGDEIIPNCLSIRPIFEEGEPVNSGTSYLVINSFLGNMNGKEAEIIQAPSDSFATVDLTQYVPTFIEGYTFVGWSMDGKTAITSVSADTFANAKKDVVEVFGLWRKDTFNESSTLNFRLDANGGTIDGESSKLFNWFATDSSKPCYLYGYTPVKENATFLGWNTKADGSGKRVYGLNYYEVNDKNPGAFGYETDENGYIKLYAIWEESWTGTKTFTIFYTMPVYMGPATGTGDINGETKVQATVELTKGQEVDVYQVFKDNEFKAFFEGKKFLKWRKSTDGKEYSGFEDFTTLTTSDFGIVTFGSGENEEKVKDAILLSAVFDTKGGYESDDYYYISLNPYHGKLDDGGTLKSIVNIIVPKSEFTSVDLTKYVPVTDDGYVFSGWYISPQNEEYGFGLEHKTVITKEDFKDSYIYAYGAVVQENPDAKSYYVRFDANGGTINGAEAKEYGYTTPNSGYLMYFEGLVPKKSGYKFTGWNTKADGTGENITALYWHEWSPESWGEGVWYEVDGNKITLYATWEKSFVKGDVDLSGTVDIADLRMMLRAVCGKVELSAEQIEAGDIVGDGSGDQLDGEITIADLRKLLRFICGKIEVLF